MSDQIVVTGVDGFVGRHVARLAAESGLSVFGISRTATPDGPLSGVLDGYAAADLRVGWPETAPQDAPIIHLAGLAAVGPSFAAPQAYIDGNSAMVTHMCESLVAAESPARVVMVSTGAVYANDGDESRHDENAAIAFTSPYVVSKVLVENQLSYYRGRGLRAVTARPFNHIGPGQGTGFLVPDLIGQLRDLAPGGSITAGNLSSRRDYTDVRDVARAYLALATAPALTHDVYNVSSGVSRSGHELLELIGATLGIDVPPVTVDTSRLRPNDPPSIVGDATRLRSAVGWAPVIPIEQTIADVARSVDASRPQ